MLSLYRLNAAVMIRMALLSDEMWARVEPLLSPVKGAMGRPMREHRDLVEGAIYRYGQSWLAALRFMQLERIAESAQPSTVEVGGRQMWENSLRVSYEGLSASPRISTASARISTLRILPVTVIGNPSTTWT